MLTILGLAGRLASPLLAFVPGFNPKLLMWLAGLFLALVVIGGPAGAVWLNMRGEVKVAVTAERAICKQAAAENEAASSKALANLLASIQAGDEDETGTAAEACKKDRFCKSGGMK
jgi:hypothetical protein